MSNSICHKIKLYIGIALYLSTMIIIGCGGGESSPTQLATGGTEAGNSSNLIIAGYVQKGPFIIGSSVTIQELDEDFHLTGISYITETNDDFGSFSISSELATSYVGVIAQGYYFNEVFGYLSPSVLTLKAYADLSTNEDVNVNILTTLSRDRIEHLIYNEGKTFNEARIQAETEILRIFNIPEEKIENVINFDQMDISKEGDSNAILLAASVILQGTNLSVANLSERIAKISQDIKDDGTLDNPAYIDELKNNAMALDYQAIRTNLVNRYSSLGVTVSVPEFEDYIDVDGDGVIDMYDYVLLSPEGPINNTRPTLDWSNSKLPDARYHFQLATDSSFNNVVEEADNLTDSTYRINSPLNNNTTYYWRVLIKSGTDGTEVNTSGHKEFSINFPAVSLLSPSGYISNTKPTLDWADSSLPDVTYNVQLSSASDFSSIIEEASNLSSSTYNITTILGTDGTYYWRVAIVDENGVTGAQSDILSFVIDTTPPTGGVLINGGDDTTSNGTVTLTITGADNNSVSEMYISMDGSFTDGVWEAFSSLKEIAFSDYTNTEDAVLTVYIKLRDSAGNVSDDYSYSIELHRTFKSGVISVDETWSLENSPYVIINNVLVHEGVSLTIDAGVEIKFNGNYSMQVDGLLIADGDPNNIILFTSNLSPKSPGDWHGIIISDTATDAIVDMDDNYVSGSIINYSKFEYGKNFYIEDSTPYLSNNIFENNNPYGYDFYEYYFLIETNYNKDSGTFIFRNNVVQDNISHGISLNISDSSTVIQKVINNIFSNNGTAIGLVPIPCDGQNIKVKANLIYDNIRAFYCSAADGETVVENNIIANNLEILHFYQGAPTIKNNTLAHNIDGTSICCEKAGNFGCYTFNTIYGNLGSTLIDRPSTLSYNNFINNTAEYVLNVSESFNASNNYWTTTDEDEIALKINNFYDEWDSPQVTIAPILDIPDTTAPISPPSNLNASSDTDSITLDWSPNPESDTAGYIVHYGPDFDFAYEHSINVGNVTSYTIQDLAPGTYYVTVTAYDTDYDINNDDPDTIVNDNQTNGNESWYAVEQVVEVGG